MGNKLFLGKFFGGCFTWGLLIRSCKGEELMVKRFERSSSGKVLFSTGNIFLGKFGPKNQNWQFVLKFRTRLIWICRNMWRICGVSFFCFRSEQPFFGKSGQKSQNCQFKLKFGTKTNLNIWNSMMMFTFSVLDQKYLFWANLVQQFKIVCSEWSLIQRLIRICKVQWWCLFYLF